MSNTTRTARITGYAAIDHSARTGATLRKYADPEDGAREVTLDEAREIAREDAGLVWCEAPAVTVGDRTAIAARFRRIGSEAEAADRAAGHVNPITDADLASALWAHHEGDLAELATDEEREAALAALVEGYRHGG